MRSLEDLDRQRAAHVAKGGGMAAPLTVSEQLLRGRAESALASLEKAKRSGDPVEVAKAKLNASRIQAELQTTNAARGSLTEMRAALARSMSRVTVL
jgi:hypothetical protein